MYVEQYISTLLNLNEIYFLLKHYNKNKYNVIDPISLHFY